MIIEEKKLLLLKSSSKITNNKQIKHSTYLLLSKCFKDYQYQYLQRKADNTSKNLLNEIRKIIYYLHQEKEITKKVYNNILNSIEL